MQDHIAFIDVVERIQKWGKSIEYEDCQEFFEKRKAIDSQIAADPSKIAAWGIMELLRRMSGTKTSDESDTTRRPLIVAGNALVLPNASIGSFLYYYTVDEGMRRYVILATDDDGHCLVAETDDFDLNYPPKVHVAADYLCPSLREAMLAAIKTDTEYYTTKLEFMAKLEAEIVSGGDLTPFFDGSE